MSTEHQNSNHLNHPQILQVESLDALVQTPYSDSVNALCWTRKLAGDFAEIVDKLALKEDITTVSIADLQALDLSEAGQLARQIICSDLEQLTAHGTLPTLNLLKQYARDDEFDYISTDVYSFHVDRSPVATETYLCTYHGTSSDILPNDQAEQLIHVPEIRKKLRELADEEEGPEFEAFLKDCYFDLHYRPKESAQLINLGTGSIWRLAVDYPQQLVKPCVHRAPKENDGEYRLLLIC